MTDMSYSSCMELRSYLYPLGFLSSIAFSLRFLVQWYLSEKAGTSIVPKTFWYLSICGYIMLFIHSFIQGQFPIYLLQSAHLVLGWRNLNLMRSNPVRLKTTIMLIMTSVALASMLYISQQWFLPEGAFVWVRSPKNLAIAPWVHVVGTVGVMLFSLRFWVQWIYSEYKMKSSLNPLFWYISLSGAILSTLYFYTIHDWVNMIGPCSGIIPYIRNMVLLRRIKKEQYAQ